MLNCSVVFTNRGNMLHVLHVRPGFAAKLSLQNSSPAGNAQPVKLVRKPVNPVSVLPGRLVALYH